MLYNLHLSPKIDPRLADSLIELLQSSLRTIVITITFVYFIWAHTVSFFLFPEPIGWQVWYILPVLALSGALAFWLIPKKLVGRTNSLAIRLERDHYAGNLYLSATGNCLLLYPAAAHRHVIFKLDNW